MQYNFYFPPTGNSSSTAAIAVGVVITIMALVSLVVLLVLLLWFYKRQRYHDYCTEKKSNNFLFQKVQFLIIYCYTSFNDRAK